MRIVATPPADWDSRITFSTLSRGFAEASATLGHRPLYAYDDDDAAVIFARRLAVPGLRSWTTRARVLLNHGHEGFVRELLGLLAEGGVSYVRVGDAVSPLPRHLRGGLPGLGVIVHHLIVHDPRAEDDELMAAMDGHARTQIRRAARENVEVSEVRTESELRDYYRLAAETAARMRTQDVGAAYPDAFFLSVFRAMVPRGQAMFLMARANDAPLAGALFLLSSERMTYFHAASTRDPELAPKQGPSAIIWHALRQARKRGVRFDLGAATPSDPGHPNYTVWEVKRRFGGQVETTASGRVILSRTKYAFQERVMLPMWKRLHPLYMRVAGAPAASGF